MYPIVYLDALMVKIRENGHVRNETIYVVIGVNMQGIKEVLGLWAGPTLRSGPSSLPGTLQNKK